MPVLTYTSKHSHRTSVITYTGKRYVSIPKYV